MHVAARHNSATAYRLQKIQVLAAMPWSECDKWAGNGAPGYQKKSSPALDTAPQTVLLCDQVSKRRRRLITTALLGHAPARSARASATSHRKSISACPHDESVIANVNVTSKAKGHVCPQHSCAPPRAPVESRNQHVKQGALSASS